MSKTKIDRLQPGDDRDLYSGLVRLHVLHHATRSSIFGLGMAQELARHGYNISPGTLYPMLHTLEKKGYLKTTQLRDGKSLRTMYRATPLGKKALRVAERRVRELLCELVETKS